jgi:hypothetical protein
MRKRPAILLMLAAAAGLLGCSPAGVPHYPVAGELYFDGQPAAAAQVILHPASEAKADDWPNGYPRGTVDEQGRFRLGTNLSDDGAPAGEYVVLVTWPQDVLPADGDDNGDSPQVDRLRGKFSNAATATWKVIVAGPKTDLPRKDLSLSRNDP